MLTYILVVMIVLTMMVMMMMRKLLLVMMHHLMLLMMLGLLMMVMVVLLLLLLLLRMIGNSSIEFSSVRSVCTSILKSIETLVIHLDIQTLEFLACVALMNGVRLLETG